MNFNLYVTQDNLNFIESDFWVFFVNEIRQYPTIQITTEGSLG